VIGSQEAAGRENVSWDELATATECVLAFGAFLELLDAHFAFASSANWSWRTGSAVISRCATPRRGCGITPQALAA
jgi:hypothetical protein